MRAGLLYNLNYSSCNTYHIKLFLTPVPLFFLSSSSLGPVCCCFAYYMYIVCMHTYMHECMKYIRIYMHVINMIHRFAP